MLDKQIHNYQWINSSGTLKDECPVYINIPLAEIRPVKAIPQSGFDSWTIHPLTRKSIKPLSYPYRIWVTEEGDVLCGEGQTIIHSFFGNVLTAVGLPSRVWSPHLWGYFQFFPDLVYISLHQDKNKALLPDWWTANVVVSITYRTD